MISTNDDVVVVHKKGIGSISFSRALSFANLVVLNGPARDPLVLADVFLEQLTLAAENKQKVKVEKGEKAKQKVEGGGRGTGNGLTEQKVACGGVGSRHKPPAPPSSSSAPFDKSSRKRKPIEAVYLDLLRPLVGETVLRGADATVAAVDSQRPQKLRRLVAGTSFEGTIAGVLADISGPANVPQRQQQQQQQDGEEVTPHDAVLFTHLFAQPGAFKAMHMHADVGGAEAENATDRPLMHCDVCVPIPSGGGKHTMATKVLWPSHSGPHGPTLNRIHASVRCIAAPAHHHNKMPEPGNESDSVGDDGLWPDEWQCSWIDANGCRDVCKLLELRTEVALALHARPGSTLTQLRAAVPTLHDDQLAVLLAGMERDGVITGYHARLSSQALGKTLLVFIEIKLASKSEVIFDKVRKELLLVADVQECHLVSGNFDYLVKARLSGMPEYRRLLGEILKTVPVPAESHSYVVIEEVKETLALRLDR